MIIFVSNKCLECGIRAALVCIVAVSVSGCGKPNLKVGKPFLYADISNNVTLAVTGVSQSYIDNQNGVPVPGLVIRDVSLIRDAADLTNSTRKVFVVFDDWFFGNLALISYNRSQAEKLRGLDTHIYNTSRTRVQVVTVDAAKRVLQIKQMSAAHVQLSVDTNDFLRIWPYTLRSEDRIGLTNSTPRM